MSVASCELSVDICQLRVDICQLRVDICQLSVASCELSVDICQLRVHICQLSVASCQLIFVSCELISFVTCCELEADHCSAGGPQPSKVNGLICFSFRVMSQSIPTGYIPPGKIFLSERIPATRAKFFV